MAQQKNAVAGDAEIRSAGLRMTESNKEQLRERLYSVKLLLKKTTQDDEHENIASAFNHAVFQFFVDLDPQLGLDDLSEDQLLDLISEGGSPAAR